MKTLGIFLTLFPVVVSAANVKLVLNWKPEAEFGGFYAAQLSKAFEKENLKVEILPGGVGTPAVQMVAANKAEFGISAADELILSQDRGTDVVGIYSVYQTSPQAFMVRADRKLQTLQQVFGEGILASQKGLPYFLFLEKQFGKPKAKVVPYLGGISQLAENPLVAQQCFLTSEPILAEKKQLPVKTFLIADSGFNPYMTLVVVKRSYAEKNRAVVEAFRRAIDAGWKEYLKDPKPANEIMHAANPSMDLETLEKSANIQKALIETPETAQAGIGSMTAARWTQMATQLKDLGLIKKVKPASDYVWK